MPLTGPVLFEEKKEKEKFKKKIRNEEIIK
jgi:hypothetical protein